MRPKSIRLIVLPVSDSFSSIWPALARDAGLELELATTPARFASARGAIGVVAAGGEEEVLEPVFRTITRGESDIEIAAISGHADRRMAVRCIRAGASELFALPDDLSLLQSWVCQQRDRLGARMQRSSSTEHAREGYRFDGILGDSPALAAALDRAARIIPHAHVIVLITGETGTGKELLARALHDNSPRHAGQFVDVNCAAIPEHLLETELFGHEKGAFTDASAYKPGLFEVASGGTLFLDEIGQLPASLQGKLLRVLQERRIRRVGGTKSIPVDVKVIAATHVNLADAVRRGEFREDLYYRLNVVPLELPPLRDRREDIVPLARHFLRAFATQYGVATPSLLPAAERALRQRQWPGNVRELRNAMERAVLLSDGHALDVADVDTEPATRLPAASGIPFPAPLDDVITAAAREMVELSGGNKSEAARRLGISRTRLQRLLEQLPDVSDVPANDQQTLMAQAGRA